MRIHNVLSGVAAISLGLLYGAGNVAMAETQKALFLAPHRAVYDVVLDDSVESKGIDSLTGRLVYETTGNTCEGFTLRARQVLNLQTEGGQVNLDSSNTSYESGDGKSIRFKLENKLNGVITEATDGEAIIVDEGALQIRLSKPESKQTSWKGDVTMPMAFVMKIIQAALSGEKILTIKTYDGTGGGESVYDTFTVIGKRIEPGAMDKVEEAARAAQLSNQPRWPVKTSYFKRDSQSGEQTPEYTVSSEVYENGVSRAVKISFSDFAIKAELKELKFLPVSSCAK